MSFNVNNNKIIYRVDNDDTTVILVFVIIMSTLCLKLD